MEDERFKGCVTIPQDGQWKCDGRFIDFTGDGETSYNLFYSDAADTVDGHHWFVVEARGDGRYLMQHRMRALFVAGGMIDKVTGRFCNDEWITPQLVDDFQEWANQRSELLHNECEHFSMRYGTPEDNQMKRAVFGRDDNNELHLYAGGKELKDDTRIMASYATAEELAVIDKLTIEWTAQRDPKRADAMRAELKQHAPYGSEKSR